MLKSRDPTIDPWIIPPVTLAQSLYEEPIFSFQNVDNH